MVTNVREVLRRTAADFARKNVTFMAAGIAYNAFVSLAPLLVLVLVLFSTVGAGLEARLLAVAEDALPGPIADVVAQAFSGEAATGASVVGLVVLVWGTLKVFRGLDTAFSEIYETEAKNGIGDQVVDGLVVFVALLAAIGATVAASGAVATLAGAVPYLGVLSPLVLLAGLVLAFFPIYYRFPDVDLGWRDALPGAVVGAVGWAALQVVFQLYLRFQSGGAQGFFGGVIVVVTWLYFSGLVLLVGAVLNAAIGGHSGGDPGGVGRDAGTDGESPDRRTTMAREDVGTYLRDLRSEIAGRYEAFDPAGEPVTTERRPVENREVSAVEGRIRRIRPIETPDDSVEVVERSRRDGRTCERSVTLRWQTVPDDESAPDAPAAQSR